MKKATLVIATLFLAVAVNAQQAPAKQETKKEEKKEMKKDGKKEEKKEMKKEEKKADAPKK